MSTTTTDAELESSAAAPYTRGTAWLRAEKAFIAVPALVWAAFAWSHRWITDDGLIAARTVRQILAGHGPVFNVGERVEANTSALWTWLIAGIAFVTRLDVYTVMLWTGMVLAPAGLVLAQLGTKRLLSASGSARPLIPFGAVVIAALPPFWDFATSGLETSLIFFWLGLCWWLLAGARDGRTSSRAAVMGLGWLVRPDMALASAVFLAVLLVVVRPSRTGGLRILLSAAAAPFAYEVFRMGYYGLLVPNTALVKEAGSSNLRQGMTYLHNYVGPYWLWVPMTMTAVVVTAMRPWREIGRRNQLILFAGAATGALSALYVVWIGGDFMHARMLLPATFALLLPVMHVPLPTLPTARAARSWAASAAIATTGLWAVVCLASLRYHQKPDYIPPSGITDERQWWIQRTGDPRPTGPGPYLAMVTGTSDQSTALRRLIAPAPASDVPAFYFEDGAGKWEALPLVRSTASVAVPGELLGTLGAIVPLDGVAVDLHGLSYAIGSHLEANGTRVGHQKSTPLSWIVADYADPAGPGMASQSDVVTARTALSCGPFAELTQATRSPLTASRFFGNILHAYSLTELRVPNDATAAEAQLCR